MIRFGVIGAGDIARTFSDAVKATSGSLYAIASRDINKAKTYQATYGFEKAYGSYEDMMKDPNVDCVYIATPHALHYEQMLLALKYHKHIICEKAFTLNEKQAKHVLDLASENKLFVMEAMWTRFLPTILELKKEIDLKTIGTIKEIRVSFGFDFKYKDKERLFNPNLGAGALLDVGIYPITFANIFLGEPTHIETKAVLIENQYDVQNEITYYYPTAKAYLQSSFQENLDNSAMILGEKGYVICHHFWSTDKATIFNLNHEVIKTIHIPHEINGFEYEIRSAIDSMNHKEVENKIMTHQSTLSILRQMDTIRALWGLKYPGE